MAKERAERFMQALQEFERTGDLDAFVQLFADDCQVSNVASPHMFLGKEGARQFWREYKSVLGNIRSTFRSVINAGDRVALEWLSQGSGYTGTPISYEGVSILEFDGDEVKRFYAYFDPHKLGMELHEENREQRTPG